LILILDVGLFVLLSGSRISVFMGVLVVWGMSVYRLNGGLSFLVRVVYCCRCRCVLVLLFIIWCGCGLS